MWQKESWYLTPLKGDDEMRTVSFLLALCLFSPLSMAEPEKYTIDPLHSSVVFKIDHLGFSYVYGMFGDISGTAMVDEKNPKNSSLDVTIKTASINTNVDKRDEHLRSPDFFNAKQFPNITFKSESIKKGKGGKYEVTGTFELHGVKKKMTVPLERHRTGKDQDGKTRTGGSADFTVKRSDFGMNFMQGENMVGDVVHLFVSLEAIKDEPKKK